MTADTGSIKAWFDGPHQTMAAFRMIVERTDRQNQFSCGLSWLDDLGCDDQVESEAVSYDSISATEEFLRELLNALPDLQFEGTLEHSWPILPCRQTFVTFSSDAGQLLWDEHCEELTLETELFGEVTFDDDEDDIEIPLTPYD